MYVCFIFYVRTELYSKYVEPTAVKELYALLSNLNNIGVLINSLALRTLLSSHNLGSNVCNGQVCVCR